MLTNQAGGSSEKFSGEPRARVTKRRDQGKPVESSSSPSEENQQQAHLKQLKLYHPPNQFATIMLQGPYAPSEIGPTNSLVNAPQYSQARSRTSLPIRSLASPATTNASVWSLFPEEDINLNTQNLLNVPPQSSFQAEYLSQANIGVANQGSAQLQEDQPVRNAKNNYGNVTNYLLPLSNLPTEFCLNAVARLPHSNLPAPFGIGTEGSPTMHEASASKLGPQEIEGSLNKARGSSNFYPTIVTSFNQLITNMPIKKRKMISLDVTTPKPNQVNWFTHGQGNQGETSKSMFPGNSLYDPIYESMGLPVDPHLRLFVANCDRGNIRV